MIDQTREEKRAGRGFRGEPKVGLNRAKVRRDGQTDNQKLRYLRGGRKRGVACLVRKEQGSIPADMSNHVFPVEDAIAWGRSQERSGVPDARYRAPKLTGQTCPTGQGQLRLRSDETPDHRWRNATARDLVAIGLAIEPLVATHVCM